MHEEPERDAAAEPRTAWCGRREARELEQEQGCHHGRSGPYHADMGRSGTLLLLAAMAHAGPWTRGAGEAYVKVEEGVFLADEYVDPRGQSQADSSYTGTTTTLYAEVGLGADFQAVISVPHVVGRNERPNGTEYLSSSGGDATFGLQWSSPWLDWPHALRVDAKVPLYDAKGSLGQEAQYFPAAGDGQVDATVWLSVGDGWGDAYGFAEVGHRFRTEIFAGDGEDRRYGDGFAANGQLGYTLWGVTAAANLSAVVPYEEDDSTKGTVDVGPSIYARVGAGLALEARYGLLVWTRNASPGQAAGVGVSYDLR